MPSASESHTRSETNTQRKDHVRLGYSGRFYKIGQFLAEFSRESVILMSEEEHFSRKEKLHRGEIMQVCMGHGLH